MILLNKNYSTSAQTMLICKPWHWNLGIGIGTGIWIGSDTTIAIRSISLMDAKLSRVVTQDQGNAPTKSRDTSLIFCLNFHKAQRRQTFQDGD